MLPASFVAWRCESLKYAGHGDDGLRDFFAEARFGVGFQLGQNHRGNFRRRIVLRLAVHFHFHGGVAVGGLHDLVRHAFDFLLHLVEFAAHEALDGINRVARVGDGLALGRVADDALAGLGERDDATAWCACPRNFRGRAVRRLP